MNIHFSSQHVELTEAIEDHARRKLKILRKHDDSIIDIHVHIKLEKLSHCAEAKLDVRGASLHAMACEDDMYAAIDHMVHKLDRQIVKHKEKTKDHHSSEVTHHVPDK